MDLLQLGLLPGKVRKLNANVRLFCSLEVKNLRRAGLNEAQNRHLNVRGKLEKNNRHPINPPPPKKQKKNIAASPARCSERCISS